MRAGELSRQAEQLQSEVGGQSPADSQMEREKRWRQVQSDAAMVVYFQPPPSADQRRIAWSLVGRAEEAQNNFRAAWNGYAAAISGSAPSNSLFLKPYEEQWRLRRGWVGLHHDVAQFDESLADFQTLLVSKPDDPYLLTGVALAHLRLKQFNQAFARIEQAFDLISQPASGLSEQQFDLEVLRRIQHAHADICVQVFNLGPEEREKITQLTRDQLIRKAEGSLQQALELTQTADPNSLADYWRLHINSDPDLEPILRGPALQALRKKYSETPRQSP